MRPHLYTIARRRKAVAGEHSPGAFPTTGTGLAACAGGSCSFRQRPDVWELPIGHVKFVIFSHSSGSSRAMGDVIDPIL